MLSLEQMIKAYPPHLQGFKRNILREYLQYKVLEALFDSVYAYKLAFLGGTALRLVYANQRFSEDLDFDNFGLTEKDFIDISLLVKNRLASEGLKVNTKNVYKGAFRCYIKIPEILFTEQLSGFKEEQILIQLDTVTNEFSYQPDKKILNKFDVFTQINVTPLDILLAQKICAAVNRKRPKGRDFYDIIFLFSLKTAPNYPYLQIKLNVKNQAQLKEFLLEKTVDLNFMELAKEIKPFLFYAKDTKKVELFSGYIKDSL